MKKLFIGVLMVLSSSLSHAEWLAVSEGNGGSAYIDLDRIVQEKDTIKVWALLDYKEEQEESNRQNPFVFKSLMSHMEFDCKKRLVREGVIHYFPEQMGQGKAVHKAYGEPLFDDILPNSFVERFFNLACKSKKR